MDWDESECFEAEVAGILDAIRDGDVPRALEEVAIIELAPGRAKRLHDRLAVSFPAGATVTVGLSGSGCSRSGASGENSDLSALNRRSEHMPSSQCPFAPDHDDLFHYGISAAIHNAGLLCERIDQQVFTGDILGRLKRQIATARVVVADLSGASANVYLEVGFAWGIERSHGLVMPRGP